MKLNGVSIRNRCKSWVSEVIKKIQITHRLDYDRYPIYLHDNIRLSSCKKEPDTVRWIEGFDKGDIVFDIGANIGAYSLIIARFAKKVYAFEPSTFTFGTLVKNLYTNRASNVIPLNVSLSHGRKIDKFLYSSINPGGSGHSFEKKIENYIFSQEVISYSIDDFVRDFALKAPQHIKLDVDGIELEILKGAPVTLSSENFKSIMVESPDEEISQISKYLAGYGLREKGRYDIGTAGMHNYYFVKEGLF